LLNLDAVALIKDPDIMIAIKFCNPVLVGSYKNAPKTTKDPIIEMSLVCEN